MKEEKRYTPNEAASVLGVPEGSIQILCELLKIDPAEGLTIYQIAALEMKKECLRPSRPYREPPLFTYGTERSPFPDEEP